MRVTMMAVDGERRASSRACHFASRLSARGRAKVQLLVVVVAALCCFSAERALVISDVLHYDVALLMISILLCASANSLSFCSFSLSLTRRNKPMLEMNSMLNSNINQLSGK